MDSGKVHRFLSPRVINRWQKKPFKVEAKFNAQILAKVQGKNFT